MSCFLRIVLFFILPLYLSGNDLKFSSISTEDGLPHPSVNCILQDRDGLMWFGTWDGLCLFDGYNITTFKPVPGDTNSLSENGVRVLFEDRYGHIWVGTDNGVNMYSKPDNAFRRYLFHHSINSRQGDNVINAIYEDNGGSLWIGSQSGTLFKYHRKKNTFIRYDTTFINSPVRYISQLEAYPGKLIIGTQNQIAFFEPSMGQYSSFPGIQFKSMGISTILADNKSIWIGTWEKGLFAYDINKKHLKHYEADPHKPGCLQGNIILSLCKPSENELWIGTRGGGLNKYRIDKDRFVAYKKERGNKHALTGNVVNSLHYSKSGILWIGTLMGGVNKLTPSQGKNKFKHYLRFNTINGIYTDNGNDLWIATQYNGLIRYNTNQNSIRKYTFQTYNEHILNNTIFSLLKTSKNGKDVIWLGSDGNGVLKFDPESNQLEAINNEDMQRSSVFEIYLDDNNNIWFGTWGRGLFVYDQDNSEFRNYRHIPGSDNTLGSDIVLDVIQYDDDTYFIGTKGGGLCKLTFRYNEPVFTTYKKDSRNRNSLSNNEVISIHKDQHGNLWLGTMGGGVNKFNPMNETFLHYKEKDGLPSNMVYGILKDKHNNMWMSTTKGISKFNPTTGRFSNYDMNDGLQDDVFNMGAFFKHRDVMFFGGPNGLNVFFPDSIQKSLNKHVPPLMITEFSIINPSEIEQKSMEHEVLQRYISDYAAFELNNNSNDFIIRFSALDFAAPKKNLYKYILEGYETEWNNCKATQNFARYTNIKPGTYFFKVKGSNNDHLWNKNPVILKIVINPPLYQTVWFRIILVAIIVFILGLITRFVFVKIKRHKYKVEEEAKKGLFAKENQLQTLINNLPDFIYIKDTKSRFILANKRLAEVTLGKGHTPEELVGKTDHNFYPPALADQFLKDEQDIFNKRQPLIGWVEPGKDEDGNRIIVSSTKIPIINDEDEVIGLVGIGRDITKLKEAEEKIKNQAEDLKETNVLLEERQEEISQQNAEIEFQRDQLEKLNKTKDKFFSIIGHDLKNPFNAILNLTDMLLKEKTRFSQMEEKEMIGLIQTSATNAFELLTNLLQWAKSQEGLIEFNPEKLDVKDVFKKNVDFFSGLIQKKLISVHLSVKSDFKIIADKNMLNTVIRNILNNAIKFTQVNGRIDMIADVADDKVEIIIRDDGTGMNVETKNNLFTLENKSKEGTMGEKGTGLGLIICKEFVEKNQGEISVNSAPGKGTEFKIRLPHLINRK
jgi:PAS domain S-box-containing protein